MHPASADRSAAVREIEVARVPIARARCPAWGDRARARTHERLRHFTIHIEDVHDPCIEKPLTRSVASSLIERTIVCMECTDIL
jgi:hypothetical protein